MFFSFLSSQKIKSMFFEVSLRKIEFMSFERVSLQKIESLIFELFKSLKLTKNKMYVF